MDDHQKLELEEKIEELESVRGRHTELVTVLIPGSQNIHTVTKQLESEKSTAANIKSKFMTRPVRLQPMITATVILTL